jgi:hypothetical protein
MVNFIRLLLKLKGYNYLIIVTNRLTKFIHLILTMINMIVTQLASLLIGHMIIYYRML